VASNRLDDVAAELVSVVKGSIWLREDEGGQIVIVCANPKEALALMNRAVAELTAPSDRTVN
jgi:hypothetical protein